MVGAKAAAPSSALRVGCATIAMEGVSGPHKAWAQLNIITLKRNLAIVLYLSAFWSGVMFLWSLAKFRFLCELLVSHAFCPDFKWGCSTFPH